LERLAFFEANDAGIGNLPAKIFGLAMLFVMLFEKNGAAGVANEHARSRKANIPSAVLNFDGTAKKSGITGHEASFLRESPMVNSTNRYMGKILWKCS
jgi:hypothetical protein